QLMHVELLLAASEPAGDGAPAASAPVEAECSAADEAVEIAPVAGEDVPPEPLAPLPGQVQLGF
ncbi:MAG: hypothetical protein M3O90_08240, partial [Actinomycetota bacterium]|nr:hypothetical protein [Actinomycetota bacterium]